MTALGEHMIKGMIERGMLVEIDHMSVKAAGRALDLLEAARYPGVISSHSWTDPHYFERVYALGGMINQYGHDAEHFVAEWARTEPPRQQHGIAGYGYGLDVNGMGRLPGPRAANAADPVTYPFTSFDGGVSFDRLRTGERVRDVNTDGVANYGLVPDWIEDMRIIAGDEIVRDMAARASACAAGSRRCS
nr:MULTISPECIES: hypothetical protein [unclassified Nonomuraea]